MRDKYLYVEILFLITMTEVEKYLSKYSYQQVLDAVKQQNKQGEPATTTDIKNYTGWDVNEKVKYRLRKLEEFGLVEVHKPGNDETGSPLPVRAKLTRDGLETMESYEWESVGEKTQEERIHELEEDVGELEGEVSELQKRVENLEGSNDAEWDAINELRAEVKRLRKSNKRVWNEVNDLHNREN
jgi:peptidoglycan hydrolase CwlO-like protein